LEQLRPVIETQTASADFGGAGAARAVGLDAEIEIQRWPGGGLDVEGLKRQVRELPAFSDFEAEHAERERQDWQAGNTFRGVEEPVVAPQPETMTASDDMYAPKEDA
jgi:hypothetical protein